MSPRQNLLRAMAHDRPEYVPRTNEGIFCGVQSEGNFRVPSWTGSWGTRWETAREDMVPFPKGNPLPDLRRVEDFAIPDPHALLDADTTIRERIAATPDREEKILLGSQVYFLFQRAWALTGMENLMVAFLEYPEELKELLRRRVPPVVGRLRPAQMPDSVLRGLCRRPEAYAAGVRRGGPSCGCACGCRLRDGSGPSRHGVTARAGGGLTREDGLGRRPRPEVQPGADPRRGLSLGARVRRGRADDRDQAPV